MITVGVREQGRRSRGQKAWAAMLALAGLLLGSCADQGNGGTETIAAPLASATPGERGGDAAALSAVRLSGAPGSVPGFEFTPPLVISGSAARVADAGSGQAIAEGDAVLFDLAQVSGVDGSARGDTYSGVPEMLLANPDSFPAELLATLVGQRVGARVLYATHDEAGDVVISAFEIRSTQGVLERAAGKAVKPAKGLPRITLAENGRPALEPAKVEPPTEPVAQLLVSGSGDVVGPDSWLAFHYSGWSWDGAEISSSWEATPLVQLLSEAIDGWQEKLVGQRVGSQVLLVMPPGQLRYEQVQGIPVDSTLVFVIDILAVINPAGGG